eukprot:scaffold1090_cov265-Pinguiococcus_pyrenoidosus.AAC.10
MHRVEQEISPGVWTLGTDLVERFVLPVPEHNELNDRRHLRQKLKVYLERVFIKDLHAVLCA